MKNWGNVEHSSIHYIITTYSVHNRLDEQQWLYSVGLIMRLIPGIITCVRSSHCHNDLRPASAYRSGCITASLCEHRHGDLRSNKHRFATDLFACGVVCCVCLYATKRMWCCWKKATAWKKNCIYYSCGPTAGETIAWNKTARWTAIDREECLSLYLGLHGGISCCCSTRISRKNDKRNFGSRIIRMITSLYNRLGNPLDLKRLIATFEEGNVTDFSDIMLAVDSIN